MTTDEEARVAQIRAVRAELSKRRTTGQDNTLAMRERGESLDQLDLRDATLDDIPGLALLHVSAWNDTYAGLYTGPGVDIREQQWRKEFESPEGWFCLVLTRPDGEIVGFSKGVFRPDHEIPGELNKIFLAREYQRMGLGRRLVTEVAQRFLDAGIDAMAAYVEPRNPSCNFFERLGGEWLIEPDGEVNFTWYVWRDILQLAQQLTQ